MNSDMKICHVGTNGWYVDTPTGREGPLATREDAERYLALIDAVCAARGEKGWSRRSHIEDVSTPVTAARLRAAIRRLTTVTGH